MPADLTPEAERERLARVAEFNSDSMNTTYATATVVDRVAFARDLRAIAALLRQPIAGAPTREDGGYRDREVSDRATAAREELSLFDEGYFSDRARAGDRPDYSVPMRKAGPDTPPASPLHKEGPTLLPCPFCDFDAELIEEAEMAFVRCRDSECGAQAGMYSTASEAIAAWNQRVPASAPPDGWRLVPVEPTEEMVEAGRKAMCPESFVSHARVLWTYEAMLSAAPPPPKEGG